MDFNFIKNDGTRNAYGVLKCNYKETYKKYCEGHFKDDRRLFINVYRQAIILILVMDKVYKQSCYLDVAFHNEMQGIFTDLKRIKERFEKIEEEEKANA
jgi:hypothetical protein